MVLHDTDTTENGLKVHPLSVEDVKRFSQWGHHTDLRYQYYNFPNLATKRGSYALNQFLWFYKRSVPYLRWLYGIEDPSGKLIGYSKVVKNHFFQKTAQFTMILDPDAMGKRYGSEAFVPLLKICFNKLGLDLVWVRVLAYNIRPLRLLEKTGFEQFKSQMEPYSVQSHNQALLQSFPDDFSLVGEKLMSKYCYLKLSAERFQMLYEGQQKPKNQEGKQDEFTSR